MYFQHSTPISESIQLKLLENKVSETNKSYYKSIIGSLTFLTVITLSHLLFIVGK